MTIDGLVMILNEGKSRPLGDRDNHDDSSKYLHV